MHPVLEKAFLLHDPYIRKHGYWSSVVGIVVSLLGVLVAVILVVWTQYAFDGAEKKTVDMRHALAQEGVPEFINGVKLTALADIGVFHVQTLRDFGTLVSFLLAALFLLLLWSCMAMLKLRELICRDTPGAECMTSRNEEHA